MAFKSRILVGNRDVGYELRLAYLLSRKRRSLLEPGTRRGRSPQGLPPWILQRPAHRRMIVIHGEVVAGVKLQPMAVGIPHIKEKRIGNPVAAGAAFDILEKA